MNNIMSDNRDQFIEDWTKKIQEWSERKYDKKTDLNSDFNKGDQHPICSQGQTYSTRNKSHI